MIDSDILICQETLTKLEQYKEKLQQEGIDEAGAYLKAQLQAAGPLDTLSVEDFLLLLINTKKPQIFAESAVNHTKADWTPIEASLLGDITVHMQVNMFNDGGHRNHKNHQSPIDGALAYVPGALLAPSSPDYQEVVVGGQLNQAKLNALYARRLLPQLIHINKQAEEAGKKAAVTLPGIGTGCFAGQFQGVIKAAFREALKAVLMENGDKLKSIDIVHYDAYNEDTESKENIAHMQFRVAVSGQHSTTGQLDFPQGATDETHLLTSFVAWDHFSFPGNDYWIGSRATDDGVKGASTDTMYKVTGELGVYNLATGGYEPPQGDSTWSKTVNRKKTVLKAPFFVVDADGNEVQLKDAEIEPSEVNQNDKADFSQVDESHQKESSKASSSSDNRFYLNCLGTLMLTGGVGMLVASVILFNPWLLIAGVACIGGGIKTLGLFSHHVLSEEKSTSERVDHRL